MLDLNMSEYKTISDEIIKESRALVNRNGTLLRKLLKLPPDRRPPLPALLILVKNIYTARTIFSLLEKFRQEESLVLMRFFLERLAIAFKVAEEGIPVEKVKNVDSKKSIKDLKKHFVDSGKWYGELSKIVHFDWGLFLGLHMKIENKKLNFRIYESDYKLLALQCMWLFFLVEISLAVVEFLAKDFVKGINSWEHTNNHSWKYKSYFKSQLLTAKWYLKLGKEEVDLT
jgi:hypothetical protein